MQMLINKRGLWNAKTILSAFLLPSWRDTWERRFFFLYRCLCLVFFEFTRSRKKNEYSILCAFDVMSLHKMLSDFKLPVGANKCCIHGFGAMTVFSESERQWFNDCLNRAIRFVFMYAYVLAIMISNICWAIQHTSSLCFCLNDV